MIKWHDGLNIVPKMLALRLHKVVELKQYHVQQHLKLHPTDEEQTGIKYYIISKWAYGICFEKEFQVLFFLSFFLVCVVWVYQMRTKW